MKEVYQNHMPKYPTIKDIDEKTRAALLASLYENEQFLAGITATDALRASRQTRLILTDQRLLTFKRKTETNPITELDRRNISHVDFEKGILTRKLVVASSDGFSQEWDLDINGASEFAEILLSENSRGDYDGTIQIKHSSGTDTEHNSPPSSEVNTRFDDGIRRDLTDNRKQSEPSQGDTIENNVRHQQPAIADLSQPELLSELQSMDDYDFEHFVADIWEEMGWDTEVSQAAVDAGIDVTATKSTPYPEKIVIQAKRYGKNTSVGGPDIQQYASLKHQVTGTDSVIIATTGSFTNAAEERADDLNVKTVDGEGIVSMIDDLDARNLAADYLDIPLESPSESPSNSGAESMPMDSHGTNTPEKATVDRVSSVSDHELGTSSSDEDGSKILHVADRIVGAANQTTNQGGSTFGAENQTSTGGQTGTDIAIDNSQSAGNWHYGVIGLSVISILTLSAGVADIAGFSLLLLLPVTYLDIRDVRTVTSEWQPKTWMYLLGMLFVVFIAAPVYLYRRKTAVGL